MNKEIIDKIDRIIAASGCSSWEIEHETTLYVPDSKRKKLGYDSITYYRGGYGYPEPCFVKERTFFNGYDVMSERVSYATPKQFLSLLVTQTYWGGMWRDEESMKEIKRIWKIKN